MQLSRIGPIALEGPLGGDADGNVLRGVHVERNLKMAVKLLPRQMINRPMGADVFAGDVKTLQKLVHRNIARTMGGAIDNGQPYLALELVEGESLRTLLDRRGRLPWETVADLAVSICEALDYAHNNAKLAHQRLTPARLILTPDGGVKLLGFDCQITDKDQVLGLRSPMCVANYLSPEAFRGKQSASLPTTDMFSLGVIMYECLTGELPWQATSPAKLVQARRDGPAPRVSAKVLECPVWLDVLVAKLLETKRGIRLATADATRRAILDAKRKAAEGMGAVQYAWSGKQGALATGADSKEISQLRRKQVTRERDDSPFYERIWFLALCLVAVVGFGVWAMWPKSEDELFAEVQPSLELENYTDLRSVSDQVALLRQKYPNTKYAKELDEYEDRVALGKAMLDIKNIDRHGHAPTSNAQSLFYQGWRHQQFGDLLSAWKFYEQVLNEVPQDATKEERAYAALARRGITEIKTSPEVNDDLVAVVRAKLDEANQLVSAGTEKGKFQAKLLLDKLVSLYDGNPQLEALVREAREQIRQIDESAK